MATTQTPTAARPSLRPAAPTPWHHLALASALLAPLLFLAGQALLPSLPDSWDEAFAGMARHHDRLMAARLLTAAAAFLFVPAIAVLQRLASHGQHHSRLFVCGASLFGVGTFFNAVSQVVEAYATDAATAPGIGHGAGLAVMKKLGTGVRGIPIGFWSIPAFAIGLLVMAAALLIARSVPAWQSLLVVVGVLLAFATAGAGPIVALTEAPLIAGLLAWTVTAARNTDPGRTVLADDQPTGHPIGQ